MDKYTDFIKRGEELFILADKIATHSSQSYSLTDLDRHSKLIFDLKALYKELPSINTPHTLQEVYISELKRICKGGAAILEDEISNNISTPEKVLDLYDVRKQDIAEIEDWILTHKQDIIAANNNQYEYYTKVRRIATHFGIVPIREKAEALILEHIEILKDILKSSVKNLPYLEELFSDYTIYPDSIEDSSYASRIAKTSGICTQSVTFMADGNVHLEMESFIPAFGHEVLGHLLNYLSTDKTDSPFFIKWGFPKLTVSCRESVTGYFESRIFDYLVEDSHAVKMLSKEEPFEVMYKRYKDNHILETYDSYFGSMARWILSQTKMDDYKKQVEWLSKYAIVPKAPSHFINYYRNDWDRSTGLLLPAVVAELRYAVNSVNNILSKYKDIDKKILDPLFIKGMWTSKGLSELVDVSLKDIL